MAVLINNPLFITILIAILGLLIGRIKIKSFSLGSSAILFVAFAFGHFGFSAPEVFQPLGLTLFIYSVGLQAGPGFVASFQRNGLQHTLCAIIIVLTGFISTIIVSKLLHYNTDMAAGIFAGAMTNTPSLAVAAGTGKNILATSAYGVTYCFGLLGVIFFVKLIPSLVRVSIPEEEKKLSDAIAATMPKVTHYHIRITNPNVFGKSLRDIKLSSIAPVAITRYLQRDSDKALQVTGSTVFASGDLIRLVGTEEDVSKVAIFFGEVVKDEIKFDDELVNQKIVVSRKEAVGRSVGSVNFMDSFNVQLARITRNGIDLPPNPILRLHIGDVLHLVGEKNAIQNVGKLIGNDIKAIYMTDVLSMMIGICFGFMIGSFPLAIPFVGKITLGVGGGSLLSGLILGYAHSTRKFVWEIPLPTSTFIRELGLVLFLTALGTTTGATFVQTIEEHGFPLFLGGAVVTLLPVIIGYAVCRRIFKIPFLYTLGVLSGSMNNTPSLSASQSYSDSHFAFSSYATVYPVAMIVKIVLTQLIFWVWHLFP